MKYTIVLTKDGEDGGYKASVPALPGCHTWGDTKRDAYKQALEAIEAYLGSLKKEGDPIPQEAGSKIVTVG